MIEKVFIIGMMGVGKSSVGFKLSNESNIKFIDIESKPELFNEYCEIIPLVKYRDKELFRYHYDHNIIKKIMMTFPRQAS